MLHNSHTTVTQDSLLLDLSPLQLLPAYIYTDALCFFSLQVAPESGALAPGEEVAMEVHFCPKEVVDCDRCCSTTMYSQALAVMNHGIGTLCRFHA